jgi:DUF1680 family protein
VVAGFAQCQEKLGTGYLHTSGDHFTPRGEAPLGLWHGTHKFLAGLCDMYVYCDNAQALGIARKLGDWAKLGADKLSDEQMQKMLAVEHGGINEAFANLYAFTGGAEVSAARLAVQPPGDNWSGGEAGGRPHRQACQHADSQISAPPANMS